MACVGGGIYECWCVWTHVGWELSLCVSVHLSVQLSVHPTMIQQVSLKTELNSRHIRKCTEFAYNLKVSIHKGILLQLQFVSSHNKIKKKNE